MSHRGCENDDVVKVLARIRGPLLNLAVPMWADKLKQKAWVVVEDRAREIVDVIASEADVLMRFTEPTRKNKGAIAKVFNALAEGLACLSFVPGGVTWEGCRYEHKHPDITYPDIELEARIRGEAEVYLAKMGGNVEALKRWLENYPEAA